VALHHRGDRFHSRCAEWLERLLIEGGPLVAPTLLEVEAAAALRRLTGDQQLVEEILAGSSALAFLELVPLTPPRAHRAAALAISTAVRGADAVYLELARERNDVLVTLDRQQLNVVPGLQRSRSRAGDVLGKAESRVRQAELNRQRAIERLLLVVADPTDHSTDSFPRDRTDLIRHQPRLP
jgi:predicted nucleic acid-binding protein